MPTNSQQTKSGSQGSAATTPAAAAAVGGDRRSADHDTSSHTASKNADVVGSNCLPLIVAGASRIADVSTVKRVIWNELLAYMFHYRSNSNESTLVDIVCRHFSSEDIADAKRLLVHELQNVAGAAQFFTERRNSVARPAREAEIDDIVGIFHAADADPGLALDGYLFVATDFKQLPKYGPEELNIAVVVDRQVQMEASIKSLSTVIQKMAASTGSAQTDDVIRDAVGAGSKDVQQQLKDFDIATSSRLDHLSAVCTQLARNVDGVASRWKTETPSSIRSALVTDDRALNVVLLGSRKTRRRLFGGRSLMMLFVTSSVMMLTSAISTASAVTQLARCVQLSLNCVPRGTSV